MKKLILNHDAQSVLFESETYQIYKEDQEGIISSGTGRLVTVMGELFEG